MLILHKLCCYVLRLTLHLVTTVRQMWRRDGFQVVGILATTEAMGIHYSRERERAVCVCLGGGDEQIELFLIRYRIKVRMRYIVANLAFQSCHSPTPAVGGQKICP